MTKTKTRLLTFLVLALALAVDPLSSITDAQDGTSGHAQGEAPRPDVLPRNALLTGNDVVADAPLGPIAVRVERVPGTADRVRLVAKSNGGAAADVEVEVTCQQMVGSPESRIGVRALEVGKERHHVRVAAGEQQLVTLATAAPMPPPPEGNSIMAFLRNSATFTYAIRIVGAQQENGAPPLVATTVLQEAPNAAAAAARPAIAAVVPQQGSPSK